MIIKKCSKCEKNKPLEKFSKHKGGKYGKRSKCKICIREYTLEYLSRPGIKEKKKICLNKWAKEKYHSDSEYYKKNRERAKKYRQSEKGKINKRKEYQKIKNDPKLHLRKNVRALITYHLKSRLGNKNHRSSFDFLPYTLDELMIHLESKFQPEMSWNNYGKWHIDHIIADCNFNYKDMEDEEFLKSWSLNNLQPLWAIDNLKKGKY